MTAVSLLVYHRRRGLTIAGSNQQGRITKVGAQCGSVDVPELELCVSSLVFDGRLLRE